jgi:hypothetical protein
MSARFHWFQGASVIKLREELNRAGDEARLEVHQEEGDQMVFYIIAPGELRAEGGGINDSFICPPICP